MNNLDRSWMSFRRCSECSEVSSNISDRVDVEEMKISGYKIHDAHFIMHYLLQIAVQKGLPKNISFALIRLEKFFKAICSKAIRRVDLEAMQTKIKEIECELEILFPPAFLDILEHSPIHFVDEIRLGPNHLRWMYSTERKLCKFNSLVRNRRYPENYIVEGFNVEEFLIFSSRYLHDRVNTPFNHPSSSKNNQGGEDNQWYNQGDDKSSEDLA